jgi:hypothetical protein
MFDKFISIFKNDKNSPEIKYLTENKIEFDEQKGFIIEGKVINELFERLEYFSNRRMRKFDDLKTLYFSAMLINEKIDLEIANQNFVKRLGNTEVNLQEFKRIVKLLTDYYYNFIRDKK